jgi:hypothetical protein
MPNDNLLVLNSTCGHAGPVTSTVSQIQQTKIARSGSDSRTLLAVSITVFAWASAFVVIRYAAHDIEPGALSLGRLLVASLALSVML